MESDKPPAPAGIVRSLRQRWNKRPDASFDSVGWDFFRVLVGPPFALMSFAIAASPLSLWDGADCGTMFFPNLELDESLRPVGEVISACRSAMTFDKWSSAFALFIALGLWFPKIRALCG